MLATPKQISLILTIAVALAMVGITAWQGYQFWQSEQQASIPEPIQTADATANSGNNVPQVQLASLPVFGSPSASGEAPNETTENLPETNLRLSLRGVLAADGEFPGSALIEDDKGNTEAYLVGKPLPGNATLRTVFPNRVIIERQGKLENLYFPEAEKSTGVFMADTETNQQTTTAPIQQQEQAQRSAPDPQSTSQQQRREEIRKRLEQLRQRLRNNN
ncbi:Type II secretion system protein N [Marinobacter litoralis]|uniref:Type II secretion system protein N n=1 Tax=Marinobacter litoralis TaxID=187981 RepID=A0A3M2RM75_9GAMM|nr:type II secretion system protein N [Marinobacter litoralis]RMJ06381.1 Type II secretion system protein N [Marinobacter litoralis]